MHGFGSPTFDIFFNSLGDYQNGLEGHSLRAGSLVWVGYHGQLGDKEQRTGEAGKKNEVRKSEPARELLIFEFRPLRGVKLAFHMCR